jgi:hypothetical protein
MYKLIDGFTDLMRSNLWLFYVSECLFHVRGFFKNYIQIITFLLVLGVFSAEIQCANSAFRDEQRRILKNIQRFGKDCCCHFHAVIFTLKAATTTCVETLDNFHHWTLLIAEG